MGGDYRLGVNFLPTDEAKIKVRTYFRLLTATQEMKLKELKNGRLAMLAFGGAITQERWTFGPENLPGHPYGQRFPLALCPEGGLRPSLRRVLARGARLHDRRGQCGYGMLWCERQVLAS